MFSTTMCVLFQGSSSSSLSAWLSTEDGDDEGNRVVIETMLGPPDCAGTCGCCVGPTMNIWVDGDDDSEAGAVAVLVVVDIVRHWSTSAKLMRLAGSRSRHPRTSPCRRW